MPPIPPPRKGSNADGSLVSGRGPATLAELYVILSPLERDFLNCLDLELAKVDQFFVARERDVLVKATALRDQLQKLELHRKLFQVGRIPL